MVDPGRLALGWPEPAGDSVTEPGVRLGVAAGFAVQAASTTMASRPMNR
jgi:hypothetical protein